MSWPSAGAARYAAIGLAAATVLTQISYPLTHGDVRDHVSAAVVVLFAAAVLADAIDMYGAVFATGFGVITAGLGLAVEIFGTRVHTRWGHLPFGSYEYASGRLGPDVAGVPLVVPLAWTAGIYCVYQVAALLCRGRLTRIALTAAGAVGWDLYLDPQMVTDGQWTWHVHGQGLPGLSEIPYTNYLGWALVATVMAALITLLPQRRRRGHLSVGVALFLWTWLGSALAHEVFLDGQMLRYSGIYGLLAMAVPGVPLLVHLAPTCREWLARARLRGRDDRDMAG